MKQLPDTITHIRATWIYPNSNEWFFFRAIKDTIEQSTGRIDFEFRCTHGNDDNFAATILEAGGQLRLRFDGHERLEDLLLRKAESPEEIILCHESLKQVLYLHLTRN